MRKIIFLVLFFLPFINIYAQDTDGDGITDSDELNIYLTDPNDADSDDDGLSDGDEVFTLSTNPLSADSDNDGLFDGTEVGNSTPTSDTNITSGNYIPDSDNGVTTTNPLIDDTDGGGVLDGNEDLNKNGIVDNGETDPNIGSDDITLSVNEFNLDKIIVYPNPFLKNIYLNTAEDGTAKIYNTLGQLILKTDIFKGENKINLMYLKSETYFLKIINKEGYSANIVLVKK